MTRKDLEGYKTVLLTHRRLAHNLLSYKGLSDSYYQDLRNGLALIRKELAKNKRQLAKVL